MFQYYLASPEFVQGFHFHQKHWLILTTGLFRIQHWKSSCPFYSAAPDITGIEGLWKLQRGSKPHGGKAQMLLRTKQKSLTFYLYSYYLNQNSLQREYYTLLSQLRVEEVPGTSFVISEKNLLGAYRDHAWAGYSKESCPRDRCQLITQALTAWQLCRSRNSASSPRFKFQWAVSNT